MENLISKIAADIISESFTTEGTPALPDGYDSIEAIPTQGRFYDAGDGPDLIAVDAEGADGVDITAISRWSALGRELGEPGFILNTRGATADFDGQTVTANYFSLHSNIAFGGSTDLLSSTALETTLKLAGVAVNVEAIVATAGNDRYLGYDEDATLYAGDGGDYVRSLGGAKELHGEAGSDEFYIRGNHGALIDGGAGTDSASFAGETQGLTIQSIGRFGALGRELEIEQNTAAYTVTHTGATAEFGDQTIAATYNTLNTNTAADSETPLSETALDTALAFGHVTTDVEQLRGSEFNDTFFGGRYADDFDAGAGNDWIDSRSGDDVIDAGAGDDNIVLSAGNNTIDGSAGEDLLWLRGSPSDFQVVATTDGSFTITTAAGDTSTLRDVENVRFSDGSIVALADLATDILPDPTPDPDPDPAPLPDLTATDDTARIDEDSSVILDLLNNDSGQGLAVIAIATPDNGSASLNGDGTVTFTPAANFNGVTEFTYTVRDAADQTASATVSVTVEQVNDAPVVTDVTSTPIAETVPGGTTLAQVSAQDVDGDALSYQIINGNDAGLFAIDVDTGAITLADGAALDYETATAHDLQVSVSDGHDTVQTTVTISVADVDEGRPRTDTLIADTNRAFGVDNGSGSIGVTGASDWDSQLPFLDIMKVSRPVKAHGYDDEGKSQFGTYDYYQLDEEGYLDENGWPTEIPEDAHTIGFIFSDTIGREGTYVLRYEGEGEIDVRYDANVISREPGKIVFEHNSGSFEVFLKSTDPNDTGDYIKNISIVKEEYVDIHDAGAVFNPDALAVLEDFRELRTMAWQRTIESPIETLDDLPSFDHATWATEYGAPIEVLVQLSNEAGTDLWFTIPTKANSDVVEYYATYIRDNLDPNLKVTVEYGNELWNNGYYDTHDLRAEAVEVWGVSPQDSAAHTAYITKKASEVALQFNAVFDQVDSDEKPLLHHTLGSQTAAPLVTENLLRAEAWQIYEPDNFIPPEEIFDSVAVTTYFGGTSITDAVNRTELLAAIEDPNVDAQKFLFDNLLDPDFRQSIPKIAEQLHTQKAIVDRYGLGLTDYEGGAHILHSDNTNLTQEQLKDVQDFLVEFYRTDYMRALYQEMWDVWREVGSGAFTNHGSVGEPSRFGFFSFLSDLADTSPRAEFLWDQNASEAAWWEDRGGEHFQQGVIETGTDDEDLLIGTNQEDYLGGGAGDDYIVAGTGDDGVHGGAGTDTILLAGGRGDYDIYRDGDAVIFRHVNGTDTVIDVEIVEFQSGEVFAINDLVKPADAPNQGPVAVDDVIDITEDERQNITTLLLNDSDADGGALVIVDVGEAEHGILRLENDGSVTYIPDANYAGPDSFTYVVSDGTDRTTATASVTVHNQVDAPTVKSEHLVVFTDDHQPGTLVYQVEASDLDGDTLTYTIASGNDDGLFVIDTATGAITSTRELESDIATPIAHHDLEVTVADGGLVTTAAITIEVQRDANLTPENGPAGDIIDGALGDNDVLQLSAYDGKGRSVGAVGNFSDQFDELVNGLHVEGTSTLTYRVYSAQFETEIDGEIFNATSANLRGDLDTALKVSNIAVNFEQVSGTEFGDSIVGGRLNDTFFGNGGADFVAGASGDDYLDGGAGNDLIKGGSGFDILVGGAGADTFNFDKLDGVDTVRDFSLSDEDQIDVSYYFRDLDVDASTVDDFLTFDLNEAGDQVLSVRQNTDDAFTQVAVFEGDDVTSLADLIARDALQFL